MSLTIVLAPLGRICNDNDRDGSLAERTFRIFRVVAGQQGETAGIDRTTWKTPGNKGRGRNEALIVDAITNVLKSNAAELASSNDKIEKLLSSMEQRSIGKNE